MFPEYRDLITQLKPNRQPFPRNAINKRKKRSENQEHGIRHRTGNAPAIEALGKEKLALKDELYQILRKTLA